MHSFSYSLSYNNRRLHTGMDATVVVICTRIKKCMLECFPRCQISRIPQKSNFRSGDRMIHVTAICPNNRITRPDNQDFWREGVVIDRYVRGRRFYF